jgi:predicted acyltransferase
LLVVLAFFFRSGGPDGIVQLRPHWWGILGLIGWAYLVAAATYLLAGDRPAVYVGAVGLLYCVYLAHEAGQVRALVALEPFVNVGRMLGSHAALAVSGTLLGLLLVRERRDAGSARRVFWRALGLAAAFGCAGVLLHSLHHLHPAFFINKVRATAPWCLASAALTTLAWLLLFLLADVKRWRRWPSTLFVAGENALVAYLLAPFVLSVFELLTPIFGGENPYARLGAGVIPGLIRSAIFALAIVWLTGALKRAGIRMHL